MLLIQNAIFTDIGIFMCQKGDQEELLCIKIIDILVINGATFHHPVHFLGKQDLYYWLTEYADPAVWNLASQRCNVYNLVKLNKCASWSGSELIEKDILFLVLLSLCVPYPQFYLIR